MSDKIVHPNLLVNIKKWNNFCHNSFVHFYVYYFYFFNTLVCIINKLKFLNL